MFPESFLFVVYTFHIKFYFSGKRERKSTKNLSKTCQWNLIFVIWSYSTWVSKHARHAGALTRKHARHVGTWARKHDGQVGTWARKHAKHVSTWARKTRNLADSYLVVFIRKINSLCFTINVFFSNSYRTQVAASSAFTLSEAATRGIP